MTQKESVTRYVVQAAKTCASSGKHFTGDNIIYLKYLFEHALEELEQTEKDYSAQELIEEILERR